MPPLPRRLAIAAITLFAMGAGATSAFAAPTTPLVKAIDSVTTLRGQNTVLETINENLHTTTGDHKTITVLVANAYNCDEAAALVARIPANSDQRTAKAHWLEGVRLQARFDVQYAAGVISILSGHKTTGFREVQAAGNESTRADRLIGGAENTLGVKVLPAPKS